MTLTQKNLVTLMKKKFPTISRKKNSVTYCPMLLFLHKIGVKTSEK